MGAVIINAHDWAQRITTQHIKRDMGIAPEDISYDEEISAMLDAAKAAGVPKAAVRKCPVEDRNGERVIIAGMELRSKLVIEMLEGIDTVYAYVVTCGRELHDWAEKYADDPLSEFYSSSIMKAALPFAFESFLKYMREKFGVDRHAALNPGSLPSWPVTGQKQVFGLIAGAENGYDPAYLRGFLGVELTGSSLMVPLKSVSGLLFATEKEWHNCMRCKKKDCPNRRAEMTEDAEDMIADADTVKNIII